MRWFSHVADGETVTEVAELYAVSQPAVSRALARLERQVGTTLLEKAGRRLRLTHAGHEFKRGADQVLYAVDDVLAAMAELTSPETGTVRLAFQMSFGTWLIPPLVGAFKAEHPRVMFDLEQSQDALGSSLVAEGRVDLELTARQPRNPEVAWRWLFSERLYLAVSTSHRLARRQLVALEEVGTEPWVLLHRNWEMRRQCDALCAAAGYAPRVVFEGDDLPTLLGFVANDLGISIVPAMGLTSGLGQLGIRLIPLRDPDAFREIGLAWSKRRRLLPAARQFREFTRAWVPERVGD